MFAHVAVKFFIAGGPIMWPILGTFLVAVAVVGERILWWSRLGRSRDPLRLQDVLAAAEQGDFRRASTLAQGSEDPVIRTIWHGLNHVNSSLQGALQVAAGVELQKAGRFLGTLDTLVTLAPLLGLLGTVTGIMSSFSSIGGEQLVVEKVTGGIGEALIATACGLGIAILCLIPYNIFNAKVAKLQFDLETAATNIDVMVNAAKHKKLNGANVSVSESSPLSRQ